MTRRFALAGGLIQILAAAGMLLLPVFATCYLTEPECRRQSYLQMGGTPVGYFLLGGMILVGIAVVASHWRADRPPLRRLLWIAAVCSFLAVIVGAWSIGLAFAPGGLLLLLSALSARRRRT